MPFTETITIINNSGKIISTGKQLVSIFKEAKASYQERKAAVKAERAIKRSQTFGVPGERHYESYEFEDRAIEDNRSYASRRSHHTIRLHSSHRHSRDNPREHHGSKSRPPLTESNLRTLSEVSSTTPAKAPQAYRSPYVESAPRDMMVSRPTLAMTQTPTENTPVSTPRQSMAVNRTRSDPSLPRKKQIDMNLAYGNIPPDLESRVDLDPAHNEENREQHAHDLVNTVENLLDEAQCVHHTATSIIGHLKKNPQAAAAVALTLAELSTLLAKMSPAFLTMIKGASPAVFALLASPQFLIGAGVAVGVTVVMFGGWKIIKHIRENKAKQAAAVAMEGEPIQMMPMPSASDGVDEALVVEEELGTIETWRRGIVPFGEDESADLELISPEAKKSMRQRRKKGDRQGEEANGDAVSRSGRSVKTHRSSKSGKSSRSLQEEVPERKSSRSAVNGGSTSVAGSHRSSRPKRSERVELKAIEAAKEDEGLDAVLRSKEKKGGMLKTLFKKKKEKDEKEAERASAAV